jgi:hypothetical protein
MCIFCFLKTQGISLCIFLKLATNFFTHSEYLSQFVMHIISISCNKMFLFFQKNVVYAHMFISEKQLLPHYVHSHSGML